MRPARKTGTVGELVGRDLADEDDEERAGEHHHLDERRNREGRNLAGGAGPGREEFLVEAEEEHGGDAEREDQHGVAHAGGNLELGVIALDDELLEFTGGDAALEFGIVLKLAALPVDAQAGGGRGDDEGGNGDHQNVDDAEVERRERGDHGGRGGGHRRGDDCNAGGDHGCGDRTLGSDAGLGGHFGDDGIDGEGDVGRAHEDDKKEQTKGATKVMARGHFLSMRSAIFTMMSRPPAPCSTDVQEMTATMMRIVETGGELGLSPKRSTRMQTPKPPAAPRPRPPKRPPMPMHTATVMSWSQKFRSISMMMVLSQGVGCEEWEKFGPSGSVDSCEPAGPIGVIVRSAA